MRIPKAETTHVAELSEEILGSNTVRWMIVVHTGEDSVRPDGDTHHKIAGPRIVLGRDPGPKGILIDSSMASRQHAELVYDKAADAYTLRDLESRNGVFVQGQRVHEALLRNGAVVRIGHTILVYAEAKVPDGMELPIPRPGLSLHRAIAESQAELVAGAKIPVLVVGPTGAGKEVITAKLHELSGRTGPLLAVNCSTFNKELIGSELFGHTAGAFSGAKDSRSGLFVSANGGTLFLDEIAELPASQQAALLRVLQEGKVRPVGSDKELDVDVRVIAATHRRLDREDVRQKHEFRDDLHARLAGFTIMLPGLRDRREEVLFFFQQFLGDLSRPLKTTAAEAMLVYDWPQNVRELKHAAEHCRLFVKNLDQISLGALPTQIREPRKAEPSEPPPAEASLPEIELTKDELMALLGQHGGNVASLSRATGKHRQQIYRLLKRYDITLDQFRADEP